MQWDIPEYCVLRSWQQATPKLFFNKDMFFLRVQYSEKLILF